MTVSAILFDLDGTVVQTREASWALFAETNREYALGIDTREQFFQLFESNIFRSLARICPDPQRAEAAKQHFMQLLRTRYHPNVIPGMVNVIRALADQVTLAVISSNTIGAIRRVLESDGIATCFAHVFSGDVEPSKGEAIRRFLGDPAYAIRRSSPAYSEMRSAAMTLNSHEVVLVTDTVGDIIEARDCGIRAIGVAWGMHTEIQLMEAGAERVALWPQELLAWLLPDPTAQGASMPSAAEDEV
jgi:phosphoglycolate phosphatase